MTAKHWAETKGNEMKTEEQFMADVKNMKAAIKDADQRGDVVLREQLKADLKRYRRETVYN